MKDTIFAMERALIRVTALFERILHLFERLGVTKFDLGFRQNKLFWACYRMLSLNDCH